MSHLSFPVAEAAIHGALTGDEKENPVRVMVGQARNRGQTLFVQGVIKSSLVREFARVGHGLFVKRIVLFLDEAKGVRVDTHGIRLCDLFQIFLLDGFQEFGEITGRGDASKKEALPCFFVDFCDDSQKRLLVKKGIGQYMTSKTRLSISPSHEKPVSRGVYPPWEARKAAEREEG